MSHQQPREAVSSPAHTTRREGRRTDVPVVGGVFSAGDKHVAECPTCTVMIEVELYQDPEVWGWFCANCATQIVDLYEPDYDQDGERRDRDSREGMMDIDPIIIIQQQCDCGKVFDDCGDDSYVCFSTPSLDGIHGIWDGHVGAYIYFHDEKKWCSLSCLFKAVEARAADIAADREAE